MYEERICSNCGLQLKRSKNVIVLSYWKASCLDREIEKYFCNECRYKLIKMPCKSENLVWQKIRSPTGKKFNR
jgi:hypothetical protein